MSNTAREIAVDAVSFRTDLYPRIETSPVTVQKYADDLTVLPPIEVNQHNELIDGWHRWMAHKKVKAETISIIVTETTGDAQLLELAISRNAMHGLQLSQADKKSMAMKIYNMTPDRERDAKKKELAIILSVSERTVREWLSRIDKDSKEARDKKIFDLWLSCHTEREIAEIVGTSSGEAHSLCSEMANLPNMSKSQQAQAEHAVEFDPPIYNIWKQQTKSSGSEHPGNSEAKWLDNLLYLYTKPFDIVVDPFAGGGSTIDLCKKRLRRYWVSDRLPIVERENEIRKHDMTNGIPSLHRWQDVGMVYLDPPYWKQAEGFYSKDPEDLANMELEQFHSTLAKIVNEFGSKIGGYVALIIQPTQWKSPDRSYTDHVAEMLRRVNLPIDMRISVPYESQQNNAQMVTWAKEQKKILVLTREIIVWKGKKQ